MRQNLKARTRVRDLLMCTRFAPKKEFMTTPCHETSAQKTAIQTIRFTVGTCTFGLVLVASTLQGICAILLGSEERWLVGQLRSIFPRATLQKESKELDEVLNRVV